ncbi:MAG: ACP S-malonyltransferase, partial [Planctomycetes bacterium]|nr:ACP S-malonyltransferase [Planctomycetota bacterium]
MKKAILLFPGQGSQSVGMGLDLAQNFPVAKAVFETADQVLGLAISEICFNGPDRELVLTHNAQPAVTAVSLAMLAVLKEAGITPLAVAGHSLGEYSADQAAGVFDVDTAIRLTRRRGELMQECADECGGTMLAVIGLEMDKVETICQEVAADTGGVINVANFNSPLQVVITGEKAPIAIAAQQAEAAGAKRTVELKVSGPWHSALLEKARLG